MPKDLMLRKRSGELKKPFFLIHPETIQMESYASLAEAQNAAELMCAEHGAAVVEIFTMTKIGTVDCLVSDEELGGSAA
jgi:hypothetical protein